MKKIFLAKADPLGEQKIEDTVINITREISDFTHLRELEVFRNFYNDQANGLADALFDSLPQGTFDRLLIALMKRKTSLYMGKTVS